MARRIDGLRNSKSGTKTRTVLHADDLNYHEGLSSNQIKVIMVEFGIRDKFDEFSKWMDGQTCPLIQRHSGYEGKLKPEIGVYEYDLFRWIANKKRGSPLVWD